MIKLYGIAQSRATRPIWVLEELGLEWTHVPVIQSPLMRRMGRDPLAANAALNTLSQSFLKMAPAGVIPVLDDDGFILSESLAITLYLTEKAGGPLAPANAHERALMTQWALYATGTIEPHALIIANNSGGANKTDPVAVEAAKAQLARPLDVLERHLAKTPYMVGDRFTVADINTCENIRYARPAEDLFRTRPHLDRWYQTCTERPAFQRMWNIRTSEVI